MIASAGVTAEKYKLNKPIYGFYLGESKQSLIQRAQKEGIACEAKGKIPDQMFPESYIFESSMNKSDLVKHVIVSFYKDHVGQVDIHLNDNSDKQFMQAAHGLDESWNSCPGYSGQTFGPMFIITIPEALITLVKAKDQTYIACIHRGLMGMFNDQKRSVAAKR